MPPAIRFQTWFVPTRKSFLLRGFLVLLLHFGIAGALGEETVWLSWDSADASEGIVSYQVYYGTNSGNYIYSDTSFYPNGDLIPGLVLGQTYYFAVASVNTNGLVSSLSQEISYTVPIPPPFAIQYQIDRDYNGNPTFLEMTANWGEPADWYLEYSYDLQTWYPWQSGYGTGGQGVAGFNWGSQVYFQMVLY